MPLTNRRIYFTVPETDLRAGGYTAEIDAMALVAELCPVELVTYGKRCDGHRYLNDLLSEDLSNAIFFVHWGPDVPHLVRKLEKRNVVYHAHSAGYGFTLPVDVPIVCVSRNTMGYWGAHSPASPIFYVPNTIPERFTNRHQTRDIDVLVQARKSSKYLLNELVPALEEHANVVVVRDWVDDVSESYNRAKVYLYDSSDFWNGRGVTEGFGLPPLEAIACGCTVFSSVNHALADFLTPGVNCHKLRSTDRQFDVHRILQAVRSWDDPPERLNLLEEYRRPAVLQDWTRVIDDLNAFFDARPQFDALIDPADRFRPVKQHPVRSVARRMRRLGAKFGRMLRGISLPQL